MIEGLFKTKKPVIGMVHLPPLLGYLDFKGVAHMMEKVQKDAKALEAGGVHSILIENMYDDPHKIFVDSGTVACMTLVCQKVRQLTELPLGINVLWNDYKAGLSIAKVCNMQFVRIPVFVDKVRTKFGDVEGNPKEVIDFRKKIGAEHIKLFVDVQVKHAKMLEEKDISLSVKQAIEAGADAVIVTGRFTGDQPPIEKVKKVREAAGDFPVIIGSGTTQENINDLFKYADGAIVGTALMTDKNVDVEKVRRLMEAIN